MKASKWNPLSRCILSTLVTIISPILFVDLWLPMLSANLDDGGQKPWSWKGGTFSHWYQRLHPWKVFHYAQTPTTKQFAMVFICQLWRVILCFIFLLQEEEFFMMFQSPHMHTHVVIRMTLPTFFPHFILVISNGPLSQNFIYTSLFSKKLCIVPYLLMLLIYFLDGQAIFQLILNPSLQLWINAACISRFIHD